eukprot:scaffold114196_cov63-Phaeocystis_antarctica.AAC.1
MDRCRRSTCCVARAALFLSISAAWQTRFCRGRAAPRSASRHGSRNKSAPSDRTTPERCRSRTAPCLAARLAPSPADQDHCPWSHARSAPGRYGSRWAWQRSLAAWSASPAPKRGEGRRAAR